MSRIQLLPEDLSHKIAAGEVIERPASVVKELVENSIDAQSTIIEVEILDGGKEYIRVTDNGVGIHPDDLQVAFMRHATSKISSVDDLFNVHTLGFRGEALSSIASISDLSLKTRQHDSPKGHQISFTGDSNGIIEPAGLGPGTTVEVRRLFYNTPARYKFLRTSATERRYIVDFISNIALAHPHISFRLLADNKVMLQTYGQGDLLTTLRAVSNYNDVKNMVKVNSATSFGSVFGYLSPPEITRGNRQGQLTILNGRIIKSPIIISAVEKAYQGLLGRRQFPVYVLLIAMDPKLVDVNVHPTKAEVRFEAEQQIFQQIFTICQQSLLGQDLSPTMTLETKIETTPKVIQQKTQSKLELQKHFPLKPKTWDKVDALFGIKDIEVKDPNYVIKQELAFKEQPVFPKIVEEQSQVNKLIQEPNATSVKEQLINGRIIGQLHQTYILLETITGLWLLDQHIVHERILYEQQLNSEYQPRVQQVLPHTLHFSARDSQRVSEHLTDLRDLGIELEDFGGNDFLLRGLPQYLSEQDKFTEQDILELLHDIQQKDNPRNILVINLACKGAIKAGQRLDTEQIRHLLAQLAETRNPFTCPHGRPIIVKLEEQEILKRFGR